MKIQDYREKGYKANQQGSFEEWSVWLMENAMLLTIIELEALRAELFAMNDFGTYNEHIELCQNAIDSRKSSS